MDELETRDAVLTLRRCEYGTPICLQWHSSFRQRQNRNWYVLLLVRFSFAEIPSITNHGSYCHKTNNASRSKSPIQKYSSREKRTNSTNGIPKKVEWNLLQKRKLTARPRRRWVSLKSSLRLFLMLILLIYPLYKHLSQNRSRLRNRLRRSIMVRL